MPLIKLESRCEQLGGAMTAVIALGKRSGERCNGVPMPWIRNAQEIAREIEEHPLAGGRRETAADL